MKVSIDFDNTLDKISVQNFTKKLIILGVEPWIVTGRYSDSMLKKVKEEDEKDNKSYRKDNNDLYEVANELDIPKDHIHFCNKELKYSYLKGKAFIWHLDDWNEEIEAINKYTSIKAIDVLGVNWRNKCLKLLNLT